MTEEIDWKSVAVRLFRADGACYLLSTPERDALEAAHIAMRAPTMDERQAESEYKFIRNIMDL